MLPSKSLADKNDKCHDGKLAKDRLSILLCSSATGEKLQPLCIGKARQPRCFGRLLHSQLPTIWKWNKTAWMTKEIFVDWLTKLNDHVKSQNRKILLFIDNCSSHEEQVLSHVKIIFFPPNCTSKLQPLDLGVIKNFKYHYRHLFLTKVLNLIETNNSNLSAYALCSQINIFDNIKLDTKSSVTSKG